MKRILSLISLLLCICLLPAIGFGEVVRLENGKYGSIFSVINLTIGDAIICGNTMITEYGSDIQRPGGHGSLYRIGAGGEVIWQLRYKSDLYKTNIFCDAIENEDGSITAALHQYTESDNTSSNRLNRYILVQVSADGNVIGEYPIEKCDNIRKLGKNFLAINYITGDDTKKHLMDYSLYSPLGEKLWQREEVSNMVMERECTVPCEGGSILTGVIGFKDKAVPYKDYIGGVMRLDTQGNTVWQLDLSKGLKEGQSRSLYTLRMSEDGNILGLGQDMTVIDDIDSPNYEVTENNGLLMKLSPEGEILWEKTFALRELGAGHSMDMMVFDKGILTAGLARSYTQVTYDLFDHNGEKIKSWTEEKREDDVIRTVSLLNLGGEIWTACTVDTQDYNHLELNRVAIPQ